MSGKENLGPGVREIVELLEHGVTTIDLREVKPGDKLYIKIGEREKDLLDFTIIRPAKPNMDGAADSAKAWLPGWKCSSKLEHVKRVEVLIGGSCTYNPGSPLGITMLTLGRLSQGRSMAMWFLIGKEDNMVTFRNSISALALVHVD